jgi:hypothetical protein
LSPAPPFPSTAAILCKVRFVLAVAALALGACGGDPEHDLAPMAVTISWEANREISVNQAGGGYEVRVAGQPVIDLPHGSGTSVTVRLLPGSHTASVRAYAAFDPQGGTTRTFSAAQELRFTVR